MVDFRWLFIQKNLYVQKFPLPVQNFSYLFNFFDYLFNFLSIYSNIFYLLNFFNLSVQKKFHLLNFYNLFFSICSSFYQFNFFFFFPICWNYLFNFFICSNNNSTSNHNLCFLSIETRVETRCDDLLKWWREVEERVRRQSYLFKISLFISFFSLYLLQSTTTTKKKKKKR